MHSTSSKILRKYLGYTGLVYPKTSISQTPVFKWKWLGYIPTSSKNVFDNVVIQNTLLVRLIYQKVLSDFFNTSESS